MGQEMFGQLVLGQLSQEDLPPNPGRWDTICRQPADWEILARDPLKTIECEDK